MRRLLFPIVLALALCVSACRFSTSGTSSDPAPPPTSSTLATSSMWPSMSAQCDGQTLKVYAAVLRDSDFVELDTGDFFVADVAGGQSGVVLTREPDTDGKIHYFATFPAPTAASMVNIAFDRGKGFEPATGSGTTVPAPFEITSPAPGSFKMGTVLSLTISPAPVLAAPSMEQMTVAISGTCLQDSGPFPVVFDASGNASFDTRQLKLADGATTGCDVYVQVRHEFNGPADPAFANASSNPVLGLQQRGFQTAIVL